MAAAKAILTRRKPVLAAAALATRMPAETPFRAVLRTGELFRRAMQPYFAGFGISGAQWGVLRNLRRAEDEGLANLRLTDLGDRLLIRPPSVTTVVRRLEAMELVSLKASPGDHRSKHLSLTPSGRRLVERILAGHAARLRELLAPLSTAEQSQLHGLLDRLASHLLDVLGNEHEQPHD